MFEDHKFDELSKFLDRKISEIFGFIDLKMSEMKMTKLTKVNVFLVEIKINDQLN